MGSLIGIGIAHLSNFQADVKQVSNTSTPSFSPSISPNTEDWLSIIQDLDLLRATAISNKDISQLDGIYSEDSSLQISDEAIITKLIAANAVIKDLIFKIKKVTLVSHRWSNQEEVVELEVTDIRSDYLVINDSRETKISSRAPETWLLSLEKVGDRWLIKNAILKLDNS